MFLKDGFFNHADGYLIKETDNRRKYDKNRFLGLFIF
jgi:hypothetical protein